MVGGSYLKLEMAQIRGLARCVSEGRVELIHQCAEAPVHPTFLRGQQVNAYSVLYRSRFALFVQEPI